MNKLIFGLLLMGLSFTTNIQAGNFYRCGNVYQDQPCTGQQPKSSSVKSAQSEVKSIDGYCSARGEKAKKIMWAREVGRTEQMQLEASQSAEEKRLITEVYSKRGSSLDVKNQIEADCMAEKEKAAQAAVLIKAAKQLQGDTKTSTANLTPPVTETQNIKANKANQQELVVSQMESKKKECASIKETIDSIYVEEREGVLLQRMEQLSQDKRDLEKKAKQLGC